MSAGKQGNNTSPKTRHTRQGNKFPRTKCRREEWVRSQTSEFGVRGPYRARSEDGGGGDGFILITSSSCFTPRLAPSVKRSPYAVLERLTPHTSHDANGVLLKSEPCLP